MHHFCRLFFPRSAFYCRMGQKQGKTADEKDTYFEGVTGAAGKNRTYDLALTKVGASLLLPQCRQ